MQGQGQGQGLPKQAPRPNLSAKGTRERRSVFSPHSARPPLARRPSSSAPHRLRASVRAAIHLCSGSGKKSGLRTSGCPTARKQPVAPPLENQRSNHRSRTSGEPHRSRTSGCPTAREPAVAPPLENNRLHHRSRTSGQTTAREPAENPTAQKTSGCPTARAPAGAPPIETQRLPTAQKPAVAPPLKHHRSTEHTKTQHEHSETQTKKQATKISRSLIGHSSFRPALARANQCWRPPRSSGGMDAFADASSRAERVLPKKEGAGEEAGGGGG